MTKGVKKLSALILSVAILAGILPFSAFAGTASVAETVGLEEVSISNSTYKYANLRIQILDDSVAVFSNPYDSNCYISSSTLLSALKSTNGYALSYTASVDGEETEADHVTDGFIKAVKNGADTIYIPIVSKNNYIDTIRLEQAGSMWTESGADGVVSTAVSAVGGKASDDYSRKVEVTTQGLTGYYLMNLEGNKDSNDTANVAGWIDNYNTTFTYVLNIYAEDVSLPVLYVNSAHSTVKNYVLARFDSDGYLCYTKEAYSGGSTSDVKTQYKLTPNKWHQLAVSFCSATWIPLIFFDGEYIGCTDAWYDWKVYQLGIGADKSKTGTVYFDDVEYYEGYYKDMSDIELSVSDGKIRAAAAVSDLTLESAKLYLAAYSRSELVGIDVADVQANGPATETELTYDSSLTYKAFLWDASLSPVKFKCMQGQEPAPAKKIGTATLVNEDFEYVCSISNQHKQNIIEQYEEEDGNTAMRFQRVNKQDFHLDANEATSYNSDVVVYELDFKILDLNSAFWLTLVGEKGSIFPAEVKKGGTLTINEKTIQLKQNEWYRFAIMVDYYDRFADYYWNGEKISAAPLPDSFGVGETAYTWRVHAPASYVDLESDRIDFLVDNMRVYEAEAPTENLSEIDREVILSDKSVFTSDVNRMKAYMEGCISIHKASGLVYSGGNRVLLENKPYQQDGKTMVNATELDSVLGKTSGLGGDVTIENYASALGLKLSVDTQATTAGMMILGSDKFEFPANEAVVSSKTELAYLNEFLLYDQPSSERIAEDYKNSSVYGVHPRIQATKEDFDRIKSEYNTNAQVKKWVDKILTAADKGLNDDAVVYELRDGVRLQQVAQEVQKNMYTYGMAYQMTGDLKYVTRAYKDLEAVCSLFPNWHPTHHIDTGMMSAAVAIGYDWMYHGFTPQQRKVIEEGAYKNGFYHINISYQTTTGPLTDTGIRIGNHNVITNGGFAMLGMAMLDAYPEISNYIVSNAIHSLGYVLNDFGKDGTWSEGPSYWELTMQYTSKILSALKSVFGQCYTLDVGEGLALTAKFMVTMQGDNGIYSYADAQRGAMYVPELFWLSEKYNQPEITPAVLKLGGGTFRDNEDYALAALWYDTSTESLTHEMPLDNLFASAHVGNMRKSYDYGSAFFAFKAGKNNIGSHSHLDAGSFIFETMGVRWADDTGYTALGYNQPNFSESEEGGRRWLAEGTRVKDHSCIEINPALDKGSDKRGEVYMGQLLNSVSPVTFFETDEDSGIVVVDTSMPYQNVASGVKRGFFFTDNRQSLVIRDEIQLDNETDVNWYLVTPATVTVTENGAILTSGDKQLKLEYIADGESTVEVEDLYSTKDGMQRITIKTRGSGLHNITVKLTPAALEGSDINDYNKDISTWRN
ncbi:MAG: heparinase II/III family protein [Clostridia bacterium]|nr:heparinase II/III family protein [Clostridia bacterium]